MLTIPELREICQKDIRGKDIWTWYSIQRRISIYFTRAFISLDMSANQVQLLSLFFSLAGAYHLFLNNYWFSFILYQIHFVTDCCDGELARYYGTASWMGLFQDRVVHMISEPLLFLSLALGIGRLELGVLPAICCENGLRLVVWGYKTSSIEESRHQVIQINKDEHSLPEKVARFFAIYGFTWLLLLSTLDKGYLDYLLIIWSIWTPLACLYQIIVLSLKFWVKR